MPKITVKYRGHLTALTKIPEEVLEGADVEAILRSIGKLYGRETAKTAGSMLIAVNGQSILILKRFKTTLKEGDVINFFPLCAGG